MTLPTAFNEQELMAEMDPGVMAAMGRAPQPAAEDRAPFDNPYDNQVFQGRAEVQPELGYSNLPPEQMQFDPPEFEIGPQSHAGQMIIPGSPEDPTASGSVVQPQPGGDEFVGEPDDDEWPDFLLTEAGLTAAQAAEYYTDKYALAKVITSQDQSYIQEGRLMESQRPAGQTSNPDPLGELPVPEFSIPQPSDGSEWGDDITNVFSALTNDMKTALTARDQKLTQIEQTYRQQQEALQRQQQQQTLAEFDHFVNNDLGDEYVGLFGRGSVSELPATSLAYRNRERLMQTAQALQTGLVARNRPPLPNDEAWTRAFMAEFPAETVNQVRRAVENQSQAQHASRQQLMTSRPTARKQPTAPLTQEEREARAAATVDKFYQDRNFPPLMGDFDTPATI